MTTTPSLPRASRARLLLLLLLLGSLVAAASASLGPGRASATSTAVHAGHGYRIAGGDFVGYYLTADGHKIYCLSPRKGVPRSVTLHPVSRYGGLSAAASAALAYALATWGDARTDRDAAIQSQVVNTLAGNKADVARRSRVLPASMRTVVASHVAQASADRGPYTVRLHLASPLTPGRSAVGEARVRTAGGHWLPGATVTLTHSANVAMPRSVRTDRTGLGRFTYTVTDVGEVAVTATATGLAPTSLSTSTPQSWEQRMVSWQARVSVHAATRFRAVPAGFSHAYDCSTTCNGRPAARLQACAVASRYASRIVYRVGSRSVVVAFPASRVRHCTVTTVGTRDGDVVTAAWQFRTSRGWSAAVPARGAFTVDCPAAPPVGVTMSYDCNRTAVTIGLAQLGTGGAWTPLVNATRHRMVLVIGGARSARIVAVHGAGAVYSAVFACGSRSALTVRAGVQRTNGAWNYGPVAAVTTP